MTVINTNTSSLIARDAIQQNDRAMSTSMERLSTGSRINSAKDDAAGLAIAERMSSTVGGLNMAVRNANDAISLLQTAEGATSEISDMLSRMRELAVQAASGTYTATDRAALDLEFGALMDEIDRIASNTEWNGTAILSGSTTTYTAAGAGTKDYNIQIGTDANQTMALNLNVWKTAVAVDTQMTAASGTGRDGVDPKVGESQIVTFETMAATNTFSVAGLTMSASGAVASATVAGVVDALSAGATIASITNLDITGTLTGYSTATASGSATLAAAAPG
jgi:flagellin